MDTVETLTQRNAEFAARRFTSGLKMMPSLKTIIIGCVDPRVDPAQILGNDPGQVVVIRDIGGRVTAATLQELALLRKLTQAAGGDLDQGWDLVILQHTAAQSFACKASLKCWPTTSMSNEETLAAQKVGDPWPAVEVDYRRPQSRPPSPERVAYLRVRLRRGDRTDRNRRRAINAPKTTNPQADAGAIGSHLIAFALKSPGPRRPDTPLPPISRLGVLRQKH